MFTTSVSEYDIRKSLSLGATYYLPKTGNYEGLKKSIRFVIEKEWKDFVTKDSNFVHQGTSLPGDFRRN